MSRGISNYYIHDLLKTRLKLPYFDSVYCADKVPMSLLKQKNKRYVCTIVNTSLCKNPGTHFLLLTISPKKIIITDSLALNLKEESPSLIERLSKSGKIIKYRFNKSTQDINGEMCGFHACLHAMIQSKERFPNQKGLHAIRPNISGEENDKNVISNITKLIKMNAK